MTQWLSALAPGGARSTTEPSEDEELGAFPLLSVAGKGIGVGVKKVAQWLRSPEGKKFLGKLKDTAKKRTSRLRFFESRARKAKTPEAKARWLKRAKRQQERIDAINQEAALAKRGVVGEGPVLEYRRNLLALEWDEAPEARRKEITATIAAMDKRLKKLHRAKKLLAETTGEKMGAETAELSEDEELGAFPLLSVAGKGIGVGVKKVAQWLRSPEGKKFLGKLKDTAKKRTSRLRFFESRARKAKTPEAKARWLKRAKRQQERIDAINQEAALAKRGVVGEGPVLEYRRNLLALEWDEAPEARRKEITATIAAMDKRLKKLYRAKKLLAETTGEKMGRARVEVEVSPPASGSQARRGLSALPPSLVANRPLTDGVGGLRFTVESPPGPGRLVRIPFYPIQAVDSWSGAGGIDFADDDPVIVLRIPPGSRFARPILLQTEQFDYGSYRILGFQTNEQGGVRPSSFPAIIPPAAFEIGDIVATYSNLSLYNGQNLFIQPDQIWSAQFNVMPASFTQTALSPFGGMRAERPGLYQRRRNRWFTGLRDYPVVTGTTNVQVIVRAFSTFPNPAAPGGPDYEFPVTCNVVAEMMTDKVYGDSVNPSPASRAGALVKVGARELGTNLKGREEIELVSAFRRPDDLDV